MKNNNLKEEIKKYIDKFVPGEKYEVSQYWSTSTDKGYDEDADVLIYIQDAVGGCDIRTIGLYEGEIIYPRQSKFDVVDKIYQNNKWYILLEE